MTDSPKPDYGALLKRSLLAIERLEARLADAERAAHEPIAVVGLSCRFPGGANDPASYWSLLARGGDAVTVVPPRRWDAEACYDPDPNATGMSYTKWGAFIEDVETFDAAFFGISPREAVSLDPQQRLLLEVTWEALENAAIAPSSLAGTRASVFVGISAFDYGNMMSEVVGARNGDAYTATGSTHSMASGRIAYFLGAQGPNYAVDTACSSSVVAIHGAVVSLRRRETGLAIAGGVNLTMTDIGSIVTSRARMMSFDGLCKTFDDSADGYVRGEGCGMLVLKRLSDAERDGDRILALIRGSAVNQDGRSSGLTAPNGAAQESVIRDALADARLSPDDISVVEAHGTGTPLGDPIEMKALGEVFGARSMDQPLFVGSVKTNIGHLESASGVAGIIKVILAMQHGAIPGHLHLNTPNRLIPWDTLPVRVPTTLTPWPTAPGTPRRAGVSSFGFSGTNSHVILEEAPRVRSSHALAPRPQLLVLSAHGSGALRQQAAQIAEFLRRDDPPSIRDLALTAAMGRSHLADRLALVVDNTASAATVLEQFASDGMVPGIITGRVASGRAPEVAFLFSGQGAQYEGMSRELYETEPVYRSALDACAAVVDPLLPLPLVPVIMGADGTQGLLDDTAFTQPALFAVEYALAQLWTSWGVEPAVVMGHSVGEYVAACVAGVFSLADGMRLIAARGRLMSALPRDGSMVAAFASRERVEQALRGSEADVSIAAVNGPLNTVISGRTAAVDRIVESLAADGIEHSRLNVSHAFHSPLMAPMLDEFERLVATMTLATPSIGLVSNVTGRLAGDEITTAAYWRGHVRKTVLFTDSIATLHAERVRTFLEIGPSPVLVGMGQRCERGAEATWLPSLRKGRADRETLLGSVGHLHVAGVPIVWKAVCDEDAHRVAMPTYPFQRERYWFDMIPRSAASSRSIAGHGTGHPLLGDRIASPLHLFQSVLSIANTPWLSDHRIYDDVLFPGTGFIELALAAAREVIGADAVALAELSLRERLVIPETGSVTVQVIVTPQGDGNWRVQVYSEEPVAGIDAGPRPGWRSHFEATASRSAAVAPDRGVPELQAEGRVDKDVPAYYAQMAGQGAHYGPGFRTIASLARSNGAVLARLHLPTELGDDRLQYILHPALLDASIQAVGAGLPWADVPDGTDELYLPVGLARYQVFRPAPTEAWCHVTAIRESAGRRTLSADYLLIDPSGATIASVEGLELHRVTRAAMQRATDATERPDWLLQVDWQPAPIENAAQPVAGRWLVIADAAPLAGELAAQLTGRGASVVTASHGEGYARIAGGWSVDFTDASHVRRLLGEAAEGDDSPWHGVVMMLGAHPAPVLDSADVLKAAHACRLSPLIAAVPIIAESNARLWIVTHATQPVGDVVPNLVDAPVWGLANVIAAEYPALRVTRIDLDAVAREDTAPLLASTLTADDREDRIALRGGQRLVARLTQGVLRPADSLRPRRLEITERGILENLALNSVAREAPGPGQVEIRVYATGLNFRDVLNALGMYPGDPGPLGNECAGVITAVGEGVDDLVVGDEVVAMIDRSFATYALAPAVQTVRKPANLSFVEAATIPVTFLTADYALNHLASMKRGDKVLIHAATGGVGMAATQLARRAGAEIFGTAGSPVKRAMAIALGADHVSDSRSLVFAERFDGITHGDGVDIVLNSLAGDFIPTSLGLLKRGGHFIEIGKTGIWDAATVAQSFPGVHYHPLYLGEIAAAEPLRIRAMLQRLMDDFASGVLTPLPQTVYPLERAEEAFRYMGQGLHTGKIVITQHRAPDVRSDASYLITGGLGGLGLACAEWLASQGARSLVLLGRHAPGADAQSTLDALRATGVTVTVASCDIAVERDVAEMLAMICRSLPPLRGILHAAGVVDDGVLSEQTMERFERVMAPKVEGGWNLHRLTRSLPIDFFVLFSSSAAMLGSPGQGNYAAANSFMDALAAVRRAQGRPAVSIAWGSWSGVGMAAGVGETHWRRWAAQGLGSIPPATGVRMLQAILLKSEAPNVAALPLDRARLPRALGPFYERLFATERAKSPVASGSSDVLQRITVAAPSERPAILATFLGEQVARVLALSSANRVRLDQSIMDIGMDSLTAMEMRNRLQGALKIKLGVADLLRGPTLDELTGELLAQLGLAGEAIRAGAEPPAAVSLDRAATGEEAFEF